MIKKSFCGVFQKIVCIYIKKRVFKILRFDHIIFLLHFLELKQAKLLRCSVLERVIAHVYERGIEVFPVKLKHV